MFKWERASGMKNKRSPIGKIVFRGCLATYGFVALITLIITVWFFDLFSKQAIEGERNCATYDAQPISTEVVRDLCERNLIPASISECNSDMAPISIQYVIDIVNSNIIPNRSTYADVTGLFGKYEILCEGPSSGRSDFRCTYNISGVGPIIFVFFNNDTKLVESVREASCRSSG
jgi:hypothetical protein